MKGARIPWTQNTFNYIWGCQKVAPECKFCYAQTDAHRYHPEQKLWGPVETSTRRTLSNDYWKQPFKWEQEAIETGEPIKVFTSSMADICEDHPIANQERVRLIQTIEATPHLIWQMLTKRPENFCSMFWEHFPEHVWAMTSAGSPGSAEKMIPELIKVDAAVKGVSIEPLIEYFDIRPYLPFLDWFIIGGESGPQARPMDLAWVEDMVGACQDEGIPVFVKQMGAPWAKEMQACGYSVDRKGEFCLPLWPESLRVQQFPTGPRANRCNPYSGINAQWPAAV